MGIRHEDAGGSGMDLRQRLSEAAVVIVGGAGPEPTIARELSAAGVGRLVLVGFPESDQADLQETLPQEKPQVQLDVVNRPLTDQQTRHLVSAADVVVDCAAGFEERFRWNRAAVRENRPMVECAVFELQAQLTTFVPGRTPCLACLFETAPPESPSAELVASGAVHVAAAGLAAMEAIKLLTEVGETLEGRLVTVDLLAMTFGALHVRRRTDCPVCQETPAADPRS